MTGPAATVRIVSTGGTFDKVYDPVSERMRLGRGSCVPTILARSGVTRVPVDAPLSIDSLEMTREMRVALLAHVRDLSRDRPARVVIVHGSGSIVETARFFLESGVPGTIVFTGAMKPFSCDAVEASFNLGGAVALAATLGPGVSIFMHGELFDPRRARKDQAIARLVHES